MFKRRKPEDPILPETRPALPSAPGGADDRGLGVPLFRPAAAILPAVDAAPPKPVPPKDALPMSRPPFPGTPAPAAPAPMQPIPARPAGQGNPAPRQPAERRTLVVGRGISVQGVVQDAERLVVEGTVEATMIHATELAIASGGVFRGECEVEDAEVAGTIDGTLTARGSLIVRATGKVLGTARCRRLQVEDGGQITGRIEMITEAARPPVAEPVRAADPAA